MIHENDRKLKFYLIPATGAKTIFSTSEFYVEVNSKATITVIEKE